MAPPDRRRGAAEPPSGRDSEHRAVGPSASDADVRGEALAEEPVVRAGWWPARRKPAHFYAAGRRAFVADGLAYNWSIQEGYFPDFEPIVDLLHVLCYLYKAAYGLEADEDEGSRWSLYEGWLVQVLAGVGRRGSSGTDAASAAGGAAALRSRNCRRVMCGGWWRRA